VTSDTAKLDRRSVSAGYIENLSLAEMTMNENVPYIWRINYQNNTASPEKVLEIAHERARQYLSRAATRSVTR
jgi:hypothetical protein